MINQMLDALQNKSACIKCFDNNYGIRFKSNNGNNVSACVYVNKKIVIFSFDTHSTESYIKEADLMAMIYYINEYGVAK